MEINNNQRVSSSFLTFTNEIECKTQGLESGPEKNYFNQPARHALLNRTDRQLTFLTGFSKKNCNTKNIPTYLTMIFFLYQTLVVVDWFASLLSLGLSLSSVLTHDFED